MPDPTTLPIAQPQEEAINIDDLAARSLSLFDGLGEPYAPLRRQVEDVKQRLFYGEIRLAVMGQFKRGKSTFINRLVGLNVLPASVVPVTSIPTFLRWGPETRCAIRFFDGKHDVVVQRSVPEMSATLTAYVTEEKNPKNRYCVSEAVVECDNAVLKNGTVLIDTPGFGSTYVHNTKTTVDLIKGCDAVLFLLSADPPFTQSEVEFLKEVKRYVPRIFFIINKIDQLTAEELTTLDSFVKTVLASDLSFATDTPLFHVSARNAPVPGADQSGRPDASGMDVVKTEIIDFMVREKYFTLSQAVTGKLKTALEAAAQKIAEDCRDIEEPMAAARRRGETLKQQCEQVRRKADKELSLIDAEIKALNDYVDKTLYSKKEALRANTVAAIARLVDAALANRANPASTVRSAFGPLFDEMFGHVFLQVITALARPLRKAVDLPYAEFAKTAEEARRAFGTEVIPHDEPDRTAMGTEIPNFTSARPEYTVSAFDTMRQPSVPLFCGKETKRGKYSEALLPVAGGIIDERFEQLSLHIKNSIRKICEACRKDLLERYGSLHDEMKAGLEETERPEAAMNEHAREKLKTLLEKRQALEELAKLLI
jgi:GTP-binding protein EngB required for normal cell division